MGKIILPPKEYINLYNQYIIEIPLDGAYEYYASLNGVESKVQEHFPFLQFTILPTVKPRAAFFSGLLIPHNKMLRVEYEINKDKGLPILAVIPFNYREIGVDVFDCCGRINWEEIDFKYRHFHPDSNNKICTHHKIDINADNCILGVLKSAYHLFDEYRKFERTGRFDLKCHPHGELLR